MVMKRKGAESNVEILHVKDGEKNAANESSININIFKEWPSYQI